MRTAVLTFPGHFFQTQLCLRSLFEHYPEVADSITVIADDVECKPWSSYIRDLADCLTNRPNIHVIPISEIEGINKCVAGWWRQQLVKLTLDLILPDDQWFVVDGDVIFRSRCEVQDRVPISRRYDAESRWSQMCELYVQNLLGISQGTMLDRDQPVITSAIPFRYLTRELLADLRHHVESRWGGDFVDLHLAWFDNQTIVADIDPPTRWVMSEWELIECFRRAVQHRELPYHDIGSGYQLDAGLNTVTQNKEIFLHSYQRDTEIGQQWFRDQGLTINDQTWQQSQAWYHDREASRSR